MATEAKWSPTLEDLRAWQDAVNHAGTMAWVHGTLYAEDSPVPKVGEWIGKNHALLAHANEMARLLEQIPNPEDSMWIVKFGGPPEWARKAYTLLAKLKAD